MMMRWTKKRHQEEDMKKYIEKMQKTKKITLLLM